MAIADTNSIIRAYLVNQTALTALVSTRIYSPRLPENATLPAIGFFTRGGLSTPYIPGIVTPSVQFDCWAESPIEARQVYRALYDALQGIQNVTFASESYLLGDDSYSRAYDAVWKAQTFTPMYSHYVDRIDLKMLRNSTPGTGTISIRATDGIGHPTGSDLTSTTINGDGLTSATAGAWYTHSFSKIWVEKDIKYAIVYRFSSAGFPPDFGACRADNSSPTYNGGNLEFSNDSGTTWWALDADLLFREYHSTGGLQILSAIEEMQGQDLQDVDIPDRYRVLTFFSIMVKAE